MTKRYCYSRDQEWFWSATDATGEPATSRDQAVHDALEDADTMEPGALVWTGVQGPPATDRCEDDDCDECPQYEVVEVHEHVFRRYEKDDRGTRVFYETVGQEGERVAEWRTRDTETTKAEGSPT